MDNPVHIKTSLPTLFLIIITVVLVLVVQFLVDMSHKIENIEKVQTIYYGQLSTSIAEAKNDINNNRNVILQNRKEILTNRKALITKRKK